MKDKLKHFLKYIRLNWEMVLSLGLGFFVVVFLAGILFSLTYLQKDSVSPEPKGEIALKVVEELPMQVIYSEEDDGLVPDDLPVKYVVKEGESSWKIAEAFYGCGENYVDIEDANDLEEDQLLEVGQELLIPRTAVICNLDRAVVRTGDETETNIQEAVIETETYLGYQVQLGDSLWLIAERELGDGMRWVEIYDLNRAEVGQNPDLIYPGTTLVIPHN